MAMTAAEVLKMVKDNEVKFVDFRFADTRGKEQHVTVPVSHFDMDKFESGHAFDGSSIAGWKGIEASDMILMPDPNTANIDPFMEETTLFMQCDVIEPSDGKGYDRDPRSIAKRAEAYLKSSGLGDTAYFGPEPESIPRKHPGPPAKSSKAATPATVRQSRAATSRFLRSTASRTCVRKCA
jgi:glutamine synthetase